MAGRALIVWMGLLAVAIVNGALRETWIVPRAGVPAGHQISTVLLAAAILLIAMAAIGWIGPATAGQAILIGLGWVSLTLAFEFLAGHYAFGKPWPELFADYDLRHGRIWVLVLIATAAAPPVAHWVRS